MNGIHGNAVRANEIENLKTFRTGFAKKKLIMCVLLVYLVQRTIKEELIDF